MQRVDISDSTFSFTLFYETSDKFAEFIVRKGHGATNALKKYKIIKLARGLFLFYMNPIMEVVFGKMKIKIQSAS